MEGIGQTNKNIVFYAIVNSWQVFIVWTRFIGCLKLRF